MLASTILRKGGLGRRLFLGFGLLLALTVLMALFCASRLQIIHGYNSSLDARAYRLSLAGQWLTQLQIASAKSETTTSDSVSAPLLGKLRPIAPPGSESSALSSAEAALRQPLAEQEKAVKALTDEMVRLQMADSAMLQAASREAFIWLAILSVASVIAGTAIALWITRSITQPLAQAVNAAERIASGQLSDDVAAGGRDETGALLRAIGTMQDQLRDMLRGVREVSGQIQDASAEISHGNHDLSQRTEMAASNLQQAASSVEELTSTMRQSADSARSADQLASSAAEVARRGGSVVSEVVTTMSDINAGSKRIADIVGVIDGIAFQTNILALNAAVEAARAGEQGRGFAVVAGEVRLLAQRCATAAKEIKSLIDTSVERVEVGSKLVEEAGSTMQDIVVSVERVSHVISQITVAATEQQAGIAQINQAVTQLDHMTQQNAALSEETAAAAESLRMQAAQLAGEVARFRLEHS